MTSILFDHQMFSLQRYGGISRYFANLYFASLQEKDLKTILGFRVSENHYIQKEASSFQKFLKRKLSKKTPIYDYNRQYSLKLINKGHFDIYHPTYYDTYALDVVKKPIVLTVHDMIHELFPQYYTDAELKDSSNKKQLAYRADKIIAISLSTKNDLVRLFNIPEHKIEVIYHGFNSVIQSAIKRQILPFDNYILFVGERIRYKNFDGFLEAFALLSVSNPTLNIVCTGGGDFTLTEREKFRKLNLENRLFQISATDQELAHLYSNARLFVFPSLYEGFGFPLLEAFSNNCPVAASNTSSFKEVGGNAISYFDPYNINSIYNSIESILKDKDVANDYREKGKARLPLFSLKNCTQKTFELYKNLSASTRL